MRTSFVALAASFVAVVVGPEQGMNDISTPIRSDVNHLTTATTLTQPSTSTFSILTYNVAGLHQAISGSMPAVNTPIISGLINTYDIVLVQEDFEYHDELSAKARHPFQSVPMPTALRLQSDGLNRFSVFPMAEVLRHGWRACNGYILGANDCLADKGFSLSRIELQEGVSVDVYNLHADAGDGAQDAQARDQEYQQLAQAMAHYSEGRAVIVAGDTNLKMRFEQDLKIFNAFMQKTGLSDACQTVGCDQESIDRVLYRSSPAITLAPQSWRVAQEFVGEDGQALSDHPAIAVDFGWQVHKSQETPSKSGLQR